MKDTHASTCACVHLTRTTNDCWTVIGSRIWDRIGRLQIVSFEKVCELSTHFSGLSSFQSFSAQNKLILGRDKLINWSYSKQEVRAWVFLSCGALRLAECDIGPKVITSCLNKVHSKTVTNNQTTQSRTPTFGLPWINKRLSYPQVPHYHQSKTSELEYGTMITEGNVLGWANFT